jgi:ankyrin repeat protein
MGIGRFMSEIVNVQDNSGDTALNIAARIGNRSIISQLLEVGADTSITNRSNLCAVDFGIGDQTYPDGVAAGGQGGTERALVKDTRESSGDIITCRFILRLVRSLLTAAEPYPLYFLRPKVSLREKWQRSKAKLMQFTSAFETPLQLVERSGAASTHPGCT